jgi:hypothetical protein
VTSGPPVTEVPDTRGEVETVEIVQTAPDQIVVAVTTEEKAETASQAPADDSALLTIIRSRHPKQRPSAEQTPRILQPPDDGLHERRRLRSIRDAVINRQIQSQHPPFSQGTVNHDRHASDGTHTQYR